MDELVGQRLGDYRLSALVSRSAFVETYQGTHVRTGANAAIKVFPTRLSGDGIDIFQREAQRLAELAHPHLVRVFDFDISGGLAFLALDALPDSLRRRYPVGTRVPVAQVIAYIGQLGGALQYGHDQGLLHGDMRPEHLLTRPGDSQVMLSDLGIAEIVRVISLANNNPVKAAGPYAAPELAGEAPSAASDQYALAVIAYEWLTGELPFPDASSVDFARQRLLDTLKGKVPALSADTGDVLITALDRVPEQRFGRVQAFATALALASGLPSQTTAQAQSAPTVLTPLTLATPTPPTVAPTAQAVTLASSPLPTQPSSPHLAAVQPTLPPYQAPAPVAPLASPYQAPSSAQPYPAAPLPYQAPAPYQLYPGAPAGPAAPSVAPTPAVSRRQLLAGLIAGAAGLIVIGVTDGIVFARMNASVAASVQPASPTLVYTHHTQNKDAEMGQIIWSADSSRIAVVPTLSLNSQIEFWDATTGQHSGAWSIPSSEDRIAASWSGDKLLVIVPDKNSKDVAIVDAASNQKIVAYTGYEKNDVLFVLNAHWSQDGKRVGSVSGFVDIWDAASGQNIISIGPKLVNNADGSGMVYSEAINNNAGQSDFAWSPDDKRIVSSSESGILRVWDTQSGQQIASYTKHWQEHAAHANLGYVSIGWMSWSPNGLFIASQGEASSGTDSTIHVWSAIDGSQVSLYKGHEGQGVNALVWSPDSSTIASVGRDGLIHVWNPMTAAKIYIRTDTASTGLAWSPKGGRIASTGAQSESTIAFQIWNATDGSQVVNYTAILSGDSYSIGSATLIAWSPDEQLIATVSEDGTTRIWKGGQ